MNMQTIQFIGTSPAALIDLIDEKVKKQLEDLKKNFQPKEQEELLTRSEVSEMFKIDLSSVHNWTKKGYLKKYAMGDGKTLYRLQEVLDAPKHIPSFNKRKK